MSLPIGRAAFDKSHVALASFIWSIMRGEIPSLGTISAIESMVFVGAAKSVAGARARTRAIVFAKIMVEVVYGIR